MYAAFGSRCGAAPFSPWIFAFDAYSIQLTNTYTQPPAGTAAGPGIWQSGAGAASKHDCSTCSISACHIVSSTQIAALQKHQSQDWVSECVQETQRADIQLF